MQISFATDPSRSANRPFRLSSERFCKQKSKGSLNSLKKGKTYSGSPPLLSILCSVVLRFSVDDDLGVRKPSGVELPDKSGVLGALPVVARPEELELGTASTFLGRKMNKNRFFPTFRPLIKKSSETSSCFISTLGSRSCHTFFTQI